MADVDERVDRQHARLGDGLLRGRCARRRLGRGGSLDTGTLRSLYLCCWSGSWSTSLAVRAGRCRVRGLCHSARRHQYGRIRLGADDDRPAFSTVSWIAMMFSAGMGIGLMFFGVSEPTTHVERRRSVSRNPRHLLPPRCPCSTPISTGRSPPGRSTAWSGSRSATRPCARDGPTSSVPRCTRCSESASTDHWARRSTSSRSGPPCSAPPRRWVTEPFR